MAVAFDHGGVQTIANSTFMSTYDMIKLQKEGEINKVFGSQRLTGLIELFGMKKMVSSSQYFWYEQNRIMPLIKATTAGGGAGAATTFTLDATDYSTYVYDVPPQYNSTVTKDNLPVRVGNIIAVRPGSGVTSASTLIRGIVYSVDPTTKTFVAYPMDSTQSFPAIATAQDIIIFSNAYGEGSNQPVGLSTKTTKRSNNTHIFKETFDITGTADALVTYFTYNGQNRYKVMGEADTLTRFMNQRELGLLYSNNLSNQTYQNLLATAGTPIGTTQGLIPTILDRGNTYNYSSVTGLTIADFESMVITLDAQKGAKNNMMFCGLELDLGIDSELRDQFKNGGVNYGIFNMEDEKAVNLGFTTFKLSQYKFSKKVLDAFNDVQTLGASGFNFKNEAILLPGEKVAAGPNGEKIDPISICYLANGGKQRDMRVAMVDHFLLGDGADKFSVRYIDECGLETPGANRMFYVKLAS